jgi:hypothetical protein
MENLDRFLSVSSLSIAELGFPRHSELSLEYTSCYAIRLETVAYMNNFKSKTGFTRK